MKGKIIHQKAHYFQIYKLCAKVKKIKCPLVQSSTGAGPLSVAERGDRSSALRVAPASLE